MNALLKTETPFAEEVRQMQVDQILLSDSIIAEILRERIKDRDARNGWILINYPQSFEQAFPLCCHSSTIPNKVIILDSPDEMARSRNTTDADSFEVELETYRSSLPDIEDLFQVFTIHINSGEDKEGVFSACVEFLDKEVDPSKLEEFQAEMQVLKQQLNPDAFNEDEGSSESASDSSESSDEARVEKLEQELQEASRRADRAEKESKKYKLRAERAERDLEIERERVKRLIEEVKSLRQQQSQQQQ